MLTELLLLLLLVLAGEPARGAVAAAGRADGEPAVAAPPTGRRVFIPPASSRLNGTLRPMIDSVEPSRR